MIFNIHHLLALYIAAVVMPRVDVCYTLRGPRMFLMMKSIHLTIAFLLQELWKVELDVALEVAYFHSDL